MTTISANFHKNAADALVDENLQRALTGLGPGFRAKRTRAAARLPEFVTGMAVVTLILRTYLEDRTLRAELEGYEEYSQQVRYRLLPGVW